MKVDENGEVEGAEWVAAPATTDLAASPGLTVKWDPDSRHSQAVSDLSAAAVRLRDAELAWKQAGADYRIALDRFNAVVAPLPK